MYLFSSVLIFVYYGFYLCIADLLNDAPKYWLLTPCEVEDSSLNYEKNKPFE